MRFQINNGWVIGQFLIPGGTIIDMANTGEQENLARGRTPPVDSCAFDADAAVLLWRAYPWNRDRLRRSLDDFEQETFERLLKMDEQTLERHWPRG